MFVALPVCDMEMKTSKTASDNITSYHVETFANIRDGFRKVHWRISSDTDFSVNNNIDKSKNRSNVSDGFQFLHKRLVALCHQHIVFILHSQ